MDIGVVAKRYAKALLQYAIDEKQEDLIYQETLLFVEHYKSVPQLAEVLHNPLLHASEKEEIICRAVSESVSPIWKNFASLVVSHHRESFMIFIAHSFITLYRRHRHICIGKLTTTVPVDKQVKQRIEQWVRTALKTSTEVVLETRVNPDIIGGFIFEVDDLRMDASVLHQFEQIKKQFIEQNKRII